MKLPKYEPGFRQLLRPPLESTRAVYTECQWHDEVFREALTVGSSFGRVGWISVCISASAGDSVGAVISSEAIISCKFVVSLRLHVCSAYI